MSSEDRKTLELLKVLGYFDLDAFVKSSLLDEDFINGYIDKDLWNVKGSVEYIKKIAKLEKFDNVTKLIKEILSCELKYGHNLMSKSMYNILKTDIRTLDVSAAIAYKLTMYQSNLYNKIRLLNGSSKINSGNALNMMENNIREFGRAWLEYIWNSSDPIRGLGIFLVRYQDDVVYRICNNKLYRFNIKLLKFNEVHVSDDLLNLDTSFWSVIKKVDMQFSSHTFWDLMGVSDIVNIQDFDLVF